MKSKIFFIVCILLCNFCFAQVQLKILSSKDGENAFPYLILNDKKAQNNINTYLHAKYLEVVPDSSQDPFKKTSNGTLFHLNHAYFDATTLFKSNYPLITISFFSEYCGAYCEGRTDNLSFDLSNGNLISNSDLFETNKADQLAVKLNKIVEKQIKDFILEIPDPKTANNSDDKEFYNDQLSIYTECLEYVDYYNLNSYSMHIKNDSIIFNRGRCSNHAMRALDDLGEFNISFSQKDIFPYLSLYGKNLFEGKPRKMLSFSDKVFEGKIGQYPIKGIFEMINTESSSSSKYFSGSYWYDKIKEPIFIKGRIVNDEYIIEEYGATRIDYNATAIFKLKKVNNQLIGTWQKVDSKNSLPVTLNFTL